MNSSFFKKDWNLPGRGALLTTSLQTFLLFVLTGFYILSVLIHLGYYPLNGDEPRRAIVAIEMRHSGNFISPTTLGWKYYNKPPLYNWIISACMFLTGSENEISVRLPSLVTMLLWGICMFQILKKIVPLEVAGLSAVFFLTSFDIFFWGLSNGGEIDIFYSFITFLQVICIYYFNERKNWIALYTTAYLLCAIGFLTKGFPSILFQILTLGALCIFNRSAKVLFRWQHLVGISSFLLLAGGYFYIYSLENSAGHYLVNLMKEALDKSIVGDYPEKLLRKVIEYPFSFIKILLPWSLLLLLLFRKRRFSFWSYPFIRFSLLFIVLNIPVYWFTGHPRMRYSYVFVPFCMTILGFLFLELRTAYPGLVKKIFTWSVILFLGILGFVLILPLLVRVDLTWYAVSLFAIGLFLYLYKKGTINSVWHFATGIILLRFLYVSLYLPYWYENLDVNYDKEMNALAAKNNFQPVSIYCKADTLDLSINLKLIKFNFDSVPAIPYLTYQIPYYYYKSSGQMVAYDTTLHENATYISFRSVVADMPVNILYSFRDKNYDENAEIVLFKLNDE
jgi:4-amino-4-deoxy-L-arabinose transferase-like glycosyltransferase